MIPRREPPTKGCKQALAGDALGRLAGGEDDGREGPGDGVHRQGLGQHLPARALLRSRRADQHRADPAGLPEHPLQVVRLGSDLRVPRADTRRAARTRTRTRSRSPTSRSGAGGRSPRRPMAACTSAPRGSSTRSATCRSCRRPSCTSSATASTTPATTRTATTHPSAASPRRRRSGTPTPTPSTPAPCSTCRSDERAAGRPAASRPTGGASSTPAPRSLPTPCASAGPGCSRTPCGRTRRRTRRREVRGGLGEVGDPRAAPSRKAGRPAMRSLSQVSAS